MTTTMAEDTAATLSSSNNNNKISRWHGPLWVALMTTTTVLSVTAWNSLYRYCFVLAAALNLFVALLLLTRALFRQALLGEEDDDKSNETELVGIPNGNPDASSSPNHNGQRHPTYLTPAQQASRSERERRLQDYSHIQAQKWNDHHFVRMKDNNTTNDNNNNNNNKETNDGGTDPNHGSGDPTSRTDPSKSRPPRDFLLLHLTPGCECYNIPALSYTVVGAGTIAVGAVVLLESIHHDVQYLSYTSLTSLVDWFRTLFLLSFGVLLSAYCLYGWTTVRFITKHVAWWCTWMGLQIRRVGLQPNDEVAAQSTGEQEQDKEEGLVDKNASLASDQEEGLSQTSEKQQQEQQSETEPTDESSDSLQKTTGLLSPKPQRTSNDVLNGTQWTAWILAVTGFVLSLVFYLERQHYANEIQPVMHWQSATSAAALDSFQGDVWVTAAQVDRTQQQGQQGWCRSTRDVIPVTLDVAWGGSWACPNSDDESLVCEATIQSHVSCELATESLPYEYSGYNNNDDNGGNDEQQEDNPEENNEENPDEENNENPDENDNSQRQRRANEEAEEEELYFATVHEYINYRYHYPIEDVLLNNDDDYFNYDDMFNNFQSNYYTTYITPDDITEQGPTIEGQDVTWNRPAEFVLANCDNCEARSLDYIHQQFPPMITALHGLFCSWGVMGFAAFWLVLHQVARQTKRQRQTTSLVATQLPGGDVY